MATRQYCDCATCMLMQLRAQSVFDEALSSMFCGVRITAFVTPEMGERRGRGFCIALRICGYFGSYGAKVPRQESVVH